MTSISFAVYGLEALTRAWALGMRLVAISSMARVIFLIASTLLIRRRVSRSWAEAMRNRYPSDPERSNDSLNSLIAAFTISTSGSLPVSLISLSRPG